MHPIFSVTLFTGQQLVLEAIQRWLQRPCADVESQRARRLGLKGLVTLLLRTAATGVLATLLDAAIEFRRRQLLAAAAAEPGDVAALAAGGSGSGSRFPGLGMVSRAGVAAWKGRLLLCIDELERRAEAYGIESRHRFSVGKPVDDDSDSHQHPCASAAGGSGKSTTASSLAALARAGSSGGGGGELGSGEEPSQHLGRTVEQLRELVKQGDPDCERRLDEEAGSLVDILLGIVPLPPSPSIAASRCRSVPSALDLAGSGAAGAAGLRASRSRASLTGAAAAAAAAGVEEQASPRSPTGSGGCPSELCQICMDRPVTVQVAGCQHDLCFGCARRLCAAQDHMAPHCPFCRQPINGFLALPSSEDSSPTSSAAAAACSAAGAFAPGPSLTALYS